MRFLSGLFFTLASLPLCCADDQAHAVLFSNKLVRLEVDGEYTQGLKVSFRANQLLYPMQVDEFADFGFSAPGSDYSVLLIQSVDQVKDGGTTTSHSIENHGATGLLELASRRHDNLSKLCQEIRSTEAIQLKDQSGDAANRDFVGPFKVVGGLAALKVLYRDKRTAILVLLLVRGDSQELFSEVNAEVCGFRVEAIDFEPKQNDTIASVK